LPLIIALAIVAVLPVFAKHAERAKFNGFLPLAAALSFAIDSREMSEIKRKREKEREREREREDACEDDD